MSNKLNDLQLFKEFSKSFLSEEEVRSLLNFELFKNFLSEPFTITSISPGSYELDLRKLNILERGKKYNVLKVHRNDYEFLYKSRIPNLIDKDDKLREDNLNELQNLIDQNYLFNEDKEFVEGLSTGDQDSDTVNKLKSMEEELPILLPNRVVKTVKEAEHGDFYIFHTKETELNKNVYLALWVSKNEPYFMEKLKNLRSLSENKDKFKNLNLVSINLSNISNSSNAEAKVYIIPGSWGDAYTLEEIKNKGETIEERYTQLEYPLYIYPTGDWWIGVEFIEDDIYETEVNSKKGFGNERIFSFSNTFFIQVNRLTTIAERGESPIIRRQNSITNDRIRAEVSLSKRS